MRCSINLDSSVVCKHTEQGIRRGSTKTNGPKMITNRPVSWWSGFFFRSPLIYGRPYIGSVVAALEQGMKGQRYDDEEFGMRDASVYLDGVYCGPPGLSNVNCGPKSDKSLCTRLPDICTCVDPFIHHFLSFRKYICLYFFFISFIRISVQGVRR